MQHRSQHTSQRTSGRATIHRSGRITGITTLIAVVMALFAAATLSAGGRSEAVELLPDLLIETDWLAAQLEAGAPEADQLVILDTGRSEADYLAGHIPGAVFFPREHYYAEVDGLPGMFPGIEEVEQALITAGVSNDSSIVVYDPGHGLWATRLFWTLELLGHDKVALLNGGYSKWSKESLAISTTPPEVSPGTFTADFQPELVVTGERLAAELENVTVVDARSRGEYEGTDVRADRGGHIPGALHIDWVLNNTGGEATTFLPVEELREFYAAELGEQSGKIVTHCQTGVRGAHTYFVLRLLGYDAALYDASWIEWGNSEEFPVATPAS